MSLKGPKGACQPYPFPGAVQPETPGDIIELRPRESFGVRVELRTWVSKESNGQNPRYVHLTKTPGTYVLYLEYTAPPFVYAPTGPLPLTPIKRGATNTLSFSVAH